MPTPSGDFINNDTVTLISPNKYTNATSQSTPIIIYKGGSGVIIPLDVTPTDSAQEIVVPEGVDGFNPVRVSPQGGKAFGASASQVLGTISNNGAMVKPNIPFTLDFSGVVSIPEKGFYYKFINNVGLTGNIYLPDLTTVGANAFEYCFYGCTNLTGTFSAPELVTVGDDSFYESLNKAKITSFSAPKIAEIPQRVFQYAFTGNNEFLSLDLSGVTTIGNRGLYNCCWSCAKVTTIDLRSVKTITGTYALSNGFENCPRLATILLGNLESITGQYAFLKAFGRTGLTSFTFEKLSTINAGSIFSGCFDRCLQLTTLSFPALKSTSFGSYTNQFDSMLSGCRGVTVHFPSNLQSVIGSWPSVTGGFGGTNTTVLFDLTATE